MRTTCLLSFLACYIGVAQAIYFTSPTAATVWASTTGQTMKWFLQPGSPVTATFTISDAEGTSTATILSDVTLASSSVAFPAGVSIFSASNRYIIHMVDVSNTSFIYAQIGPFEIDAFEAIVTTAPATTAPVTATTTTAAAITIVTAVAVTTTSPVASTVTVTTSPSKVSSSTSSMSASVISSAPSTLATKPSSANRISSSIVLVVISLVGVFFL